MLFSICSFFFKSIGFDLKISEIDFFTTSSYPLLLSNIAFTFFNSSSNPFSTTSGFSNASSLGNSWKFGSICAEFIISRLNGVTISNLGSLLSSFSAFSFISTFFSIFLFSSVSSFLSSNFSESAVFSFCSSTVSELFTFSDGFTIFSNLSSDSFTSFFCSFEFFFIFCKLLCFSFSFSSKSSIHSFSFSASSSFE